MLKSIYDNLNLQIGNEIHLVFKGDGVSILHKPILYYDVTSDTYEGYFVIIAKGLYHHYKLLNKLNDIIFDLDLLNGRLTYKHRYSLINSINKCYPNIDNLIHESKPILL